MARASERSFNVGDWLVEPERDRITRGSESIYLRAQVMELLVYLARHPNRVISADELLADLWTGKVVTGGTVYNCVAELRQALANGEDSAAIYIETIPKKGYRLVAPVREFSGAEALEATATEPATRTPPSSDIAPESTRARRRTKWPTRRMAVLTGLGALAAVTSIAALLIASPPVPTVTGYTKLTTSQLLFPPFVSPIPMVTDGSRIYFNEWQSDSFRTRQISVTGGEAILVSSPFDDSDHFMQLSAITPDRTQLIITRHEGWGRGSFWLWPIVGGSPRRLGEVEGLHPNYSPDGKRLVYAKDNELYVARGDGSGPRKLLTAPGRVYWPRISPDGRRIRFTAFDNKSDLPVLWEVSADGSDPRPLFPEWGHWPNQCCGSWTPDGRYYVFQGTGQSGSQLWAIRERPGWPGWPESRPVQLTPGPLEFLRPLVSLDGKKIFAIGWQLRGELVRYDTSSRQFVPHLSPAVSAEWVAYSPDRQWIAYVTYPEAELWRSRSDGSNRLQLTFSPMRAFDPAWSPDGRTLAFVGQHPGQHWKIHTVAAEGGTAKPLTAENRLEMSPAWSSDGQSLAFSLAGDDGIRVFDLATASASGIEASQGLHWPRWSPGGRYIAAHSTDHRKLMVLDTTTGRWELLAERDHVANHYWLQDEQHLYFNNGRPVLEPLSVYRVRIQDKSVERIAALRDVLPVGGIADFWIGLTPDGSPLLLRDLSIHHIYALDWEHE